MNSHCLFGHKVLSIAFSVDATVLIYLKSLLRLSSFVLLLLSSPFYSVVPLNSIHRYSTFFPFCFMYLNLFFKMDPVPLIGIIGPDPLAALLQNTSSVWDSSVFC